MKKAAAETDDDDDDLLDMGFWEGRLPMYDMSVCSYELLATTPVFFFFRLAKAQKAGAHSHTEREREREREREDRRRNEEDVPRKKRNETSGIDLFL